MNSLHPCSVVNTRFWKREALKCSEQIYLSKMDKKVLTSFFI